MTQSLRELIELISVNPSGPASHKVLGVLQAGRANLTHLRGIALFGSLSGGMN